MEASMTTGFEVSSSFSWTEESSSTFTKDSEEGQSATMTVKAGKVSSMCQPQGSIGEYKIYSSYFARFSGTTCSGNPESAISISKKTIKTTIIVLCVVGIPILILLTFVVVVNIMQRMAPRFLPEVLKTWDFLPLPLRSLSGTVMFAHGIRVMVHGCKWTWLLLVRSIFT